MQKAAAILMLAVANKWLDFKLEQDLYNVVKSILIVVVDFLMRLLGGRMVEQQKFARDEIEQH